MGGAAHCSLPVPVPTLIGIGGIRPARPSLISPGTWYCTAASDSYIQTWNLDSGLLAIVITLRAQRSTDCFQGTHEDVDVGVCMYVCIGQLLQKHAHLVHVAAIAVEQRAAEVLAYT